MAQKSWFFNSAPNDPRIYQASDFAQYFGKVLSTGLLHVDEVPGLQVKADGTDLRTYVEPGGAIMEGYAYENTDNEYLAHNLPEVSLDRIDRVVLRLDKKNANRYIKLFIREGEPSTEPVAPTLQRDNLVWELSLAQVRIRANTSTIKPADVFDERLDRTVCGLVFSLISKPSMADIQTGGYAVTATVEGQTEFEIPLQSFDKVGDGLTVFVSGKKAEYSSYQVLYPRTVRFNTGLPLGTLVEFEIIRGVLILEDGYVVTAGKVGINDAGNYYDSENVEGALQEIGNTLYKKSPPIYGFRIDEANPNSSTSVTYIDDAANIGITSPDDWKDKFPFNKIKPCLVNTSTGKLVYYLNPNNYAQQEDGSPADITSIGSTNVMIEIPTIWFNIKRYGTIVEFRVSEEKIDSEWFAMPHVKNNKVLPYIYMGAYLSVVDVDAKSRSISGRAPTSVPVIATARTNAANNNMETCNYYQRFFLLNVLFWLKYKNRDSSLLGITTNNPGLNGTMNTLGMDSSDNGVPNLTNRTKFLGMEHMFLEIAGGELIDGFRYSTNIITLKTEDYAGSSPGASFTFTPQTNNNYITRTSGDAGGIGTVGLFGGGSTTTHYGSAQQSIGGSTCSVGFNSVFSMQQNHSYNRVIYRPDVDIH